MILERIDEVGAKRRKDSVVMQDCLITATPEWIKGKSLEEQQEFFRYALEFATERFGQENMIGLLPAEIPQHERRKPLSPELREACRRLDRYTEQIDLLAKHHFKTVDEIDAFKAEIFTGKISCRPKRHLLSR